MGEIFPKEVGIRTETIALGQFLKFAGIVDEGGEAKRLIQAGEVQVDGETETRRGRKLRPGDVVSFQGESYAVKADEAP